MSYPRQKINAPQAHTVTLPNSSSSSTWLLDSSASHHVTNDLQNLSLNAPYDGTEKLIIVDDTGLYLSHVGIITLTQFPCPLKSNNVLCVPSMSRNLISISQFCLNNNTSIKFLPNFFHVKDLKTGVSLFQGLG